MGMENVNKYFYGIAQIAAQSAAENKGLTNIRPEFLYCQFYHETGGFTSELQASNHNLGGLTQAEPNDSKQPDGNCYYMNFDSFEDYGIYFGKYLGGFVDGGIDQATTLEEYVTALKNSPSGAYFGDSLENYLNGCQAVWNECFA
jgi:hypothetical protein